MFDLNALKKHWQPQSALAVTLAPSRTTVDHVRVDAGAIHVVRSMEIPLGADAVVADPEKAAAQLSASLAAHGIRERRCVVCVPPSWAMTSSSDVPALAGDDLQGYLELRAEREFPVPVQELRLAHGTCGLPDGKQQLTLAAVSMKRFGAVEKMVQAAGGRLVSLSLGLDRCVLGEQTAALHLLAQGDHVAAVVAAGNGISVLRALPGAAATEPFDAAGFSREIRITLGKLPGPIRQAVRQVRFEGAPAAVRALFEQVEHPLQTLGLECATPGAEPPPAAQAAAARFLAGQPVAFEFVPAQTRRWQSVSRHLDSRNRRWLLGLCATACIGLATAFFVRNSQENRLNAEWQGMRRTVSDLEALQQKIRQFRPWFEAAPQGLQALETLSAAFPDQGEVWAKTIQFSGDPMKVNCAGFAKNQAALMGFVDRLRARPDVQGVQIQQVRGENPLQFSLTYKWEARDAK
jgi:hypothetical protein